MLIDYKIRSISEADGVMTLQAIFYKGDITTELEIDPLTMKMVPVTRYRRFSTYNTKNYTKNMPGTSSAVDRASIEETVKKDLRGDKNGIPIPEQL